MPRPLILIYIIAAATLAVFTTTQGMQPALFFIEFMAPNAGDTYNETMVVLIVMMIFLMPLMVFLLITKVIRKKPEEIIGAGRTGIFVTREKAFQSVLVGIPIYIDSVRAGFVDNGKTKFFDVPAGPFTIQAGKRKQASEDLEGELVEKEQRHFAFSLSTDGLFVKIELEEITKE